MGPIYKPAPKNRIATITIDCRAVMRIMFDRQLGQWDVNSETLFRIMITMERFLSSGRPVTLNKISKHVSQMRLQIIYFSLSKSFLCCIYHPLPPKCKFLFEYGPNSSSEFYFSHLVSTNPHL